MKGQAIAGLSALIILLASLAPSPAFALPIPVVPPQEDCQFFSTSQRYNTQAEGDVVVIGAQPNQRYRVIIESRSADTLSAIRACVVDAFLTRSALGTYINVGSFKSRSDADTIRQILRRSGYPARTIYVRPKTAK